MLASWAVSQPTRATGTCVCAVLPHGPRRPPPCRPPHSRALVYLPRARTPLPSHTLAAGHARRMHAHTSTHAGPGRCVRRSARRCIASLHCCALIAAERRCCPRSHSLAHLRRCARSPPRTARRCSRARSAPPACVCVCVHACACACTHVRVRVRVRVRASRSAAVSFVSCACCANTSARSAAASNAGSTCDRRTASGFSTADAQRSAAQSARAAVA
jgi:hypothetical protein